MVDGVRLGLRNTHAGMPTAPSALALVLRSVFKPADRVACVAPKDICKNVFSTIEAMPGVGAGVTQKLGEFNQVAAQVATSETEQVPEAQAHLRQTRS